ncbi:polysaccharide biosynthesis protein [Winogradskyella immobilis]|uniref:Polysaccharide biosynthesis protein n=1 Tax=Winogradskyella immobilis TaxID=2816852 RepID=A0ABS8EK74_9FLAO|nr:polysaccharide biosynthesis protein [Winogradskyella immobilis]MCC1483495.1 polysaccharide biosynthesis protein [Winogradskyella immobilis]MCG0015589.1 polysaccharide biosynthesis protein [Winogradskyella immobilis]
MKSYYKNKTILITGGAGSIGSELVKQLIELEINTIIIIDQSELALYNLELNFKNHTQNNKLVFLLADIRNDIHLDKIFDAHTPDIVFHTAAYKQLPLLEKNPSEGVLTNIYATINLVKLSNKYKAENFMLISTDKAVEPTSVLGRTKRIAELYVNNYKSSSTKLSIIRFGNVYKSNGSVVEVFNKQIEQQRPITLTHKDVERYFISINDACNSVIKACYISSGGDTFIIDMGKPQKIYNLVKQIIKNKKLPEPIEKEIKIIGLRPGEKLSEKLVEEGIRLNKTEYDKITYYKSFNHLILTESSLKDLFLNANQRNDKQVIEELKRILKEVDK